MNSDLKMQLEPIFHTENEKHYRIYLSIRFEAEGVNIQLNEKVTSIIMKFKIKVTGVTTPKDNTYRQMCRF